MDQPEGTRISRGDKRGRKSDEKKGKLDGGGQIKEMRGRKTLKMQRRA